MRFSELAQYFQKLENTTSRNSMTEILADLFKKAEASEINKICYLTQGRVAPLFVALEFGMAEKMMIKAMARGCEIEEKEALRAFQDLGDLGKVVEKIKSQKLKVKNSSQKLKVTEVFEVLEKVAKSSGSGSVEQKVRLLADLLKKVDSLSARYIVRIPLAKMRLGFSDMTVLDALSWLIGKNKEARKEIEKAYNVRPDLGFIAKTVKNLKVSRFKSLNIRPEVGTPILMARAERLSSGQEIIEKIGRCAIEPKLDGFRLQVHFSKFKMQKAKGKNASQNLKLFEPQDTSDGGRQARSTRHDSSEVEESVRLFSRNLEDVTLMYPDIVAGVVSQIKADEAIFEGEAIGWDEKKQKYLAFQETTQRRRKYHIKEMSQSVPLKLVVFDLLYVDGENLIEKPFLERRKRLEEILF